MRCRDEGVLLWPLLLSNSQTVPGSFPWLAVMQPQQRTDIQVEAVVLA
jgi:hypothetical protein